MVSSNEYQLFGKLCRDWDMYVRKSQSDKECHCHLGGIALGSEYLFGDGFHPAQCLPPQVGGSGIGCAPEITVPLLRNTRIQWVFIPRKQLCAATVLGPNVVFSTAFGQNYVCVF